MYMKKFTFKEANEIMKNGFLNTDTPYEEINRAEKSFGIKRYSDCLCNRCERRDVCYIGSEEIHNWVDETIHNAIMECNYFMKPFDELTKEEKWELAMRGIEESPKMSREEVIQILKEEPYFDSKEEELEWERKYLNKE